MLFVSVFSDLVRYTMDTFASSVFLYLQPWSIHSNGILRWVIWWATMHGSDDEANLFRRRDSDIGREQTGGRCWSEHLYASMSLQGEWHTWRWKLFTGKHRLMTSELGKGRGSCSGIPESHYPLQTMNSWISFLTCTFSSSVSLGNRIFKEVTLNYH